MQSGIGNNMLNQQSQSMFINALIFSDWKK